MYTYIIINIYSIYIHIIICDRKTKFSFVAKISATTREREIKNKKYQYFAPDKKTKNISALGVFIALVLVANTMGTVVYIYIYIHMYVKTKKKSTWMYMRNFSCFLYKITAMRRCKAMPHKSDFLFNNLLLNFLLLFRFRKLWRRVVSARRAQVASASV